jgi:outer membrane lipoprotein-sorting protein
MRITLLALLLPAVAVRGSGDAEKAFRDFEKKIASAKALHVVGDIVAREKDKEAKLHFAMTLAQGNKVRMTMKGKVEGKEMAFEVISDGKNLAMSSESVGKGKGSGGPTPDRFTEMLGTVLSRVGVVGGLKVGPGMGIDEKNPDLEKMFGASNFKDGKAEKINGRQTRVIRYDVKIHQDKAKVTLWLDASTGLPVKREIVADNGKAHITETYTEFNLNPQLDAKTFELPK